MENKNAGLVALGLDFGGTKLLIGEVTIDGKILHSKRYPSQVYAGAKQAELMQCAMDCIDDYIETFDLIPGTDFQAIGAGLIGRIDPVKGLWLEIEPTRVKTIPVVETLSKRYNVPTAIDNDVRCSVSAEMAFGLGRCSKNFIYMNVGTGIGAGFVVNGQKLTGDHFNGGEVGHTVPNYTSDVECSCGRMGCVEAVASGMGIEARANKLHEQYPHTRLKFSKEGKVDARNVFRLADEGDALCRLLADDAVKALAETIKNLIWVSDPDMFILGGGLVTDGWLLKHIKEQIEPGSIRFLDKGLLITQLDSDNVGLIGAGATGFLSCGMIK